MIQSGDGVSENECAHYVSIQCDYGGCVSGYYECSDYCECSDFDFDCDCDDCDDFDYDDFDCDDCDYYSHCENDHHFNDLNVHCKSSFILQTSYQTQLQVHFGPPVSCQVLLEDLLFFLLIFCFIPFVLLAFP